MVTRRNILVFLVVMLMSIFALSAQAQGISSEVTVTCPEGGTITNGVEITGNVRPGEYRITLLGINGFDPIGAIVDPSGVLGCADDSSDLAPLYQANLPPMGNLTSSTLNSALFFRNNSNDFREFSVIVGGFGGQTGEVLVVLEDLRVTSDDGRGEGAGDPFGVRITQNLLNSGLPVIAYMLGVDAALDPFIAVVSGDTWIRNSQGTPLVCDDGGVANRCFNTGASLATSVMVVNDGGTSVVGDSFDAMLQIDPAIFDTSTGDIAYFHFTSFNQASTGNYVAAFRLPIGSPTGTIPPTTTTTTTTSQTAGGVSASGALSAAAPEAFFSFVGVQGETVTITAQNTTSGGTGIDTVVELLNEQGVVLVSNDDHGSNDTTLARFDSRISNFSLPVGGAYFIRVTSFSGRDTGSFQVTLNKSGTPATLISVTGITSGTINTQPTPAVIGQATPTIGLLLPTQPPLGPTQAPITQATPTAQAISQPAAAISISYGQTISGELTRDAVQQDYVFNASAGDVVTITMRSIDPAGLLDPRLFLVDASGTTLTDHDDVGGSGAAAGLGARDAQIQGFTIPAAGAYTIEATSFAGASFGTYEISLVLGSGTNVAVATTAPAATATTGGGGLGTLLSLPTATPQVEAPQFELPPLTNTLSFDDYSLQAPADWTSIESDNFDVIGNDPEILQIAVTGGTIDAMSEGSIVVAVLQPDFLQRVNLITEESTPADLLDNLFANPANTLLSPVEDYTAALGPFSVIARNIEGSFPANTVVIGTFIEGEVYGFIVFSSFSYDVIEPLIASVIGTLEPIGAPLPVPTVAATATAGSLPPAPTPTPATGTPLTENVSIEVEGGTFTGTLPPGWQIDVNEGGRIAAADNAAAFAQVLVGDFDIINTIAALEIAPPAVLADLTGIDTGLSFEDFAAEVGLLFGEETSVEITNLTQREVAIIDGDEDSTTVARILINTDDGVLGVIVLSNQSFELIRESVLQIVDTFDYTLTESVDEPVNSATETLTVAVEPSGQISFTVPEGWVGEDNGSGTVVLGSNALASDAASASDPISELQAGDIAIQVAVPVPGMLENFGVTDPNLNPDSMLSAILTASNGTGKIEVLEGLSYPAVIAIAEIEILSQPVIVITVQYPAATITYAVYSQSAFTDIADVILPILESADYQP